MSDALSRAVEIKRELVRRRTEGRLAYYKPYAPQLLFHELGKHHRERALLAANQSGKSYSACAELAMHLTAGYPDWWPGRRFTTEISAWGGSDTLQNVRDGIQRLLIGSMIEPGTGLIPKEAIIEVKRGHGVADIADLVLVKSKHGISRLGFRTYEAGRAKWATKSLHVVLFDEEPPSDIYGEGLARITARKGMTMIAATPLQGTTSVIERFYPEPTSPDRGLVMMTLEDAEHISEEDRKRITEGYAIHERQARTEGIPLQGSGLIYPVSEDLIACDPFPIPGDWKRIAGMDLGGFDSPVAVVWLAIDPNGAVFVYDEYKVVGATIPVNAAAIRSRGHEVRVAWPSDANSRDRMSGKPFADLYREQGLHMMPTHAAHEGGGVAVEPAIEDIHAHLALGRLKIFRTCGGILAERRGYHRVNGKIHKHNDHLLDALRYGWITRHKALLPIGTTRRIQVQAIDDKTPEGEFAVIEEGSPFSRASRINPRDPRFHEAIEDGE